VNGIVGPPVTLKTCTFAVSRPIARARRTICSIIVTEGLTNTTAPGALRRRRDPPGAASVIALSPWNSIAACEVGAASGAAARLQPACS